jgi:LPS-assembly protein
MGRSVFEGGTKGVASVSGEKRLPSIEIGSPRTRITSWKSAVAVSTAVLAMASLPSAAMAQVPSVAQGSAATSDAPFYFESDLLVRDGTSRLITASGRVRVQQSGRTLNAEQVTYDPVKGTVIAKGGVRLVNPDGSVETAEELNLDRDLTAGFAKNISASLAEGGRITAETLTRDPDGRDQLNNAVFTACPVCTPSTSSGRPPWAIRATKITQDHVRQTISYEHAVIELYGIPVASLPMFWHPDASVDRKSGFLAPDIAVSRRRGLSFNQPYLQVISKSEDIVFTPQINTKVNPFLETAWRRRFATGEIHARLGVTHESDLDGNGDKLGDNTFRSFILADGRFEVSEAWHWGFTAERASEDLIFDKYDIRDVDRQRGLVPSQQGRLVSQIYGQRQNANSYLSMSLISIQGLRPTDIDRTFPSIAPLIEGYWSPKTPVMGGRLVVSGHAVALTREQDPFNPALPGVDSRTANLNLNWTRNYYSPVGLVATPFVEARADLFSLADLPGTATIGQTNLLVGTNLGYPLVRRQGAGLFILEPLAQIAVSPNTKIDPRIPNEDSTTLEFDETTLFRADKFRGFDRYERGARANLGLRASYQLEDGRAATLLIGRSWRDQVEPAFAARTGLRGRASDWVVAATGTTAHGISLFARARIADQGSSLRRLEGGADFETERSIGYIRYLRDNEDQTGKKREDLDFAGEVQVAPKWALSFRGVADLQENVWRRQEIGLVRKEDCLRFEMIYEHSETINRTLGPSDSLKFRLTLATLGDTGYSLRRRYD